jgi:hypothetical protein
MHKSISSIFAITWLIIACGNPESQQGLITKDVAKELNEREIRIVTDGEIIDRAFELGRMVADSAQASLIQELLQAIEAGGIVHAIDFCNVNALPILKSVSEEYGVEVRRASNRWRNPLDQPNEAEAPLLEAYEYNMENDIELSDNVQKIGTDYILYTKPIVMGSGLCLNCHGIENTQVQAETMEALQTKYPNDNALNHELGDLRGIWSIKIARRKLVLMK